MQGMIFNIERYAIHDGKGIRTQVFLKGCSMRCLWCANPEGLRSAPDLSYQIKFCIGCKACVAVCPQKALRFTDKGIEIQKERCDYCGLCEKECYAGALELLGKKMTVEEVIKEVKKDTLFYEASGGGGMTLCGGEPLLQVDFAKALLKRAKEEGISTAVETCGNYPFSHLEKVIPYLDFIYYDIKAMDNDLHKACTGQENKRILENLKLLQNFDVPICVRIPVIPGYNDSEENLLKTAQYVKTLPKVTEIELLPYHRLGVNKYEKLRIPYLVPDETKMPEKEEMKRYRDKMLPAGVSVKIG